MTDAINSGLLVIMLGKEWHKRKIEVIVIQWIIAMHSSYTMTSAGYYKRAVSGL